MRVIALLRGVRRFDTLGEITAEAVKEQGIGQSLSRSATVRMNILVRSL